MPRSNWTSNLILLLLTVRVFSVDRNVARTLHALLAFFLLCYIPAQVAKTLVCIPVQAFWDTNVVNFKCIDQTKLFLYDGSISIVSDLVILVVPIPLTWALRVSLARKVKVVALLGAGGVAFAVTVYRVYLTIKFADTKDPTVDFIPLDWTVTGELAIGIVCACFPSINHLLERRSATRVSSNSSTAGLSWWRKASKDCLDSLSSWGMNRRSRLAAGNRIGLQNTTADSNARLASTPGSTPGTERDEPQQSDYDIELAVISMPQSEPHPGELVTTRVSNRNDGLLSPLPLDSYDVKSSERIAQIGSAAGLEEHLANLGIPRNKAMGHAEAQ
ncbi:integral membrane protein [Colletotrichum filicis]|nr:integral membrane protein [Colletotrichum filicis]